MSCTTRKVKLSPTNTNDSGCLKKTKKKNCTNECIFWHDLATAGNCEQRHCYLAEQKRNSVLCARAMNQVESDSL